MWFKKARQKTVEISKRHPIYMTFGVIAVYFLVIFTCFSPDSREWPRPVHGPWDFVNSSPESWTNERLEQAGKIMSLQYQFESARWQMMEALVSGLGILALVVACLSLFQGDRQARAAMNQVKLMREEREPKTRVGLHFEPSGEPGSTNLLWIRFTNPGPLEIADLECDVFWRTPDGLLRSIDDDRRARRGKVLDGTKGLLLHLGKLVSGEEGGNRVSGEEDIRNLLLPDNQGKLEKFCKAIEDKRFAKYDKVRRNQSEKTRKTKGSGFTLETVDNSLAIGVDKKIRQEYLQWLRGWPLTNQSIKISAVHACQSVSIPLALDNSVHERFLKCLLSRPGRVPDEDVFVNEVRPNQKGEWLGWRPEWQRLYLEVRSIYTVPELDLRVFTWFEFAPFYLIGGDSVTDIPEFAECEFHGRHLVVKRTVEGERV